MALFTQDDLVAGIPQAKVLLALDDDADGVADAEVFPRILAEATEWVSGFLEQAGLELPSPPPARLKFLGVKYAEYALWRRRGDWEKAGKVFSDWIEPGQAWLGRIATGQEKLSPAESLPSAIVTEPARFHSSGGEMMV